MTASDIVIGFFEKRDVDNCAGRSVTAIRRERLPHRGFETGPEYTAWTMGARRCYKRCFSMLRDVRRRNLSLFRGVAFVEREVGRT